MSVVSIWLLRYAVIPIASAVTTWLLMGGSIASTSCSEPQQNRTVGNAVIRGSGASNSIPSSSSEFWDVTDLPIKRSIYDGFRPVYVYSMVPFPELLDPLGTIYSQSGQDGLVVKLMEHLLSREGDYVPFFVDLAANDALTLSNTYHLERQGWDGVCVEPNPMYWYRLAAYLTCAIVGAFVGVPQEEDGQEVDVVLSSGVFGGIVAEGLDNAGADAEEKRNLVSISTIFKQTSVPARIDYLSLDVEGAELLVMKHFPFETHTVRFITIERPRTELKELLVSKGYTLMRMISSFGESLWMHDTVQLSAEEVDAICQGLKIRAWSEKPQEWLLPEGVVLDDTY